MTGLQLDKRSKIEKLTKEHGGAYSPSCHEHVTYLIAEVPEGAKYDYAVEAGIKVQPNCGLSLSHGRSFTVSLLAGRSRRLAL